MNQETHAHPMIANVAREMANELYEAWAKDNDFYRQFPEGKGRRAFVKRVAPKMLGAARGVLAQMLNGSYPENTKVAIYEALQLDKTLVAGRMERAPLPH